MKKLRIISNVSFLKIRWGEKVEGWGGLYKLFKPFF